MSDAIKNEIRSLYKAKLAKSFSVTQMNKLIGIKDSHNKELRIWILWDQKKEDWKLEVWEKRRGFQTGHFRALQLGLDSKNCIRRFMYMVLNKEFNRTSVANYFLLENGLTLETFKVVGKNTRLTLHKPLKPVGGKK